MDRRFVGLPERAEWQHATGVERATYVCGYCGDKVGSNTGYPIRGVANLNACIRICPSCSAPTYFNPNGEYFPKPPPGREVQNIDSNEVESLYKEARLSSSVGAPTAAVMASRKILMNVAHAKGACEGKSFIEYVEYLDQKGYIPPDGKTWVDYIRKRGNEANHEIALMKDEDAQALIKFVEVLLTFVYEFANAVPSPLPAKT
jgi:hypothetical protein